MKLMALILHYTIMLLVLIALCLITILAAGLRPVW